MPSVKKYLILEAGVQYFNFQRMKPYDLLTKVKCLMRIETKNCLDFQIKIFECEKVDKCFETSKKSYLLV